MQPLGHHITIGLRGRQLDIDSLVARLDLRYQVGQRQIGIRTRHQVGMMVVQQVFLHTLSHTAQHTNNER